MSEFEVVRDLVDAIESGIGSANADRLRRLLENRAHSSSINKELMDYLADETELNHFVEAFKDARNLQICFIIDITGSFLRHSENFKNNILGAIIDGVMRAVNKSKKRYAYIGYRERDEDHDLVNFTEELSDVTTAIRNAKIEGGGDDAEDVEFAFDLFIKNINFKGRGTRIIIHVADAPCHGARFHDPGYPDNYPERSDNISDKLRMISNNLNCFYWFVKLTSSTDKMIIEFNKILEKECQISGFNKINVIDLRSLKKDLSDMIKGLLQESILRTALQA